MKTGQKVAELEDHGICYEMVSSGIKTKAKMGKRRNGGEELRGRCKGNTIKIC